MGEPLRRAGLGEGLKVQILVMQSGWQDAKRTGQLQRYMDGVGSAFRNGHGQDLRAIALTERGFVPR